MFKGKETFMLAAFAASQMVHAASLCGASEVAVFSCQLKENKKFVSLCSSKDLSDKSGFLQYRYGAPGKIELRYPEDLTGSQSRFGYDSYSRPDLSTFVLGFDNANYRYEISETTEGGDDEGTTARTLLVSSDDKKHSMKLTCLDDKNLVSNISTLEGVVSCDKKHEIVDGSCN
ncbi:hypothetical protein [Paraburkholderia phenazinium]|uniref:hypothetical protein n=1 Tax=Paraburkholderia phenazinium TaxID=60549 RepID=UPI00158A2FDC|nr:hypothetical protein [Paraburkholderia phenazinium]